jgi:Na+/melibiose symporter-like transporter
MAQYVLDPVISSSITSSIIPLTLGLTLFTNKIVGAVAGVIGGLILILPPYIYIRVTDGTPGDLGTMLKTTIYLPTYFVVVLAIIITNMAVMRR